MFKHIFRNTQLIDMMVKEGNINIRAINMFG